MLAALLSLAIAAGNGVAAPHLPNRPVASLDLQRYSGHWHEIAHLPMYFQRQCVDTITATYTPQPDGTLQVRNACRRNDGRINAVIGAARAVAGTPGALQVRFAPRWLTWLPMVWADYWVLDLDPDYQWAVVGGPSRKALWVLARAPEMERTLFERLKADARARGYPVERLVVVAPLR